MMDFKITKLFRTLILKEITKSATTSTIIPKLKKQSDVNGKQ